MRPAGKSTIRALRMKPATILVVFGTRPEAIKLAPLITELRREPSRFDVRLCVTGQHREMLDQALGQFDLVPDIDLDVMRHGQDLAQMAGRVVLEAGRVVRDVRPDLVIVQGDTTTAIAAALAAFYEGATVAHVEAGLRSGDDRAPWPEEVNRKMVSVIARIHFAPTEDAKANLLREGIDPSRVFVTGNTVVDALHHALARIASDQEVRERLKRSFSFLDAGRPMILVTGHRRESFGRPIQSVCEALAELARAEDVEIVYPVHLNPNVQKPVRDILGGNDRIHLIEPVDYLAFVYLMQRSTFILTDSGGVQEEAPALGKAVLVTRDRTERPEGVAAGNLRIVGTERAEIVAEARLLLRDSTEYAARSEVRSPFGDGRASQRIAAIIGRLCADPEELSGSPRATAAEEVKR